MAGYSVNLTDTFSDALKNCPSRVRGSFTGICSHLRNIGEDALQGFLSTDVNVTGMELYTMPAGEGSPYEFLAGRVMNAFILIFIGKSEEVIKWRVGHRIIWNSQIQELQISKTFKLAGIVPELLGGNAELSSASGAETSSNEEEQKSDLLKKLSEDELSKLGVPAEQFALVGSIDCLTVLQKYEEVFSDGVFERLRDIITGTDTAENIIFEIRSSLENDHDISEQISRNPQTRRHICSCDDLVIKEFFISGNAENFDKWMAFLHPSQNKYVTRNFKGPFKLSGGAGTGKTVVALHRMKWLASTNEKNRILYLTFTKALSENISVLKKKIGCHYSRCENTNINSLLTSLAFKYEVIDKSCRLLTKRQDRLNLMTEAISLCNSGIDKSPSFLLDEYDQVILQNGIESDREYFKARRAGRGNIKLTRADKADVWEILEKYNDLKDRRKVVDVPELYALVTEKLEEFSDGLKPYRNVIVDEFQDLGSLELKFIRALVPHGDNDIFLVGDPYQKIYSGSRVNFSKCGIDIRGQSRQLKINYRTTDEIRSVAVSAVKNLEIDDGNDGTESLKGYFSVMHGERPQYIFFRRKDDEYRHIADTMKDLLVSDDYRKWALCVTTPFRDEIPVIANVLENYGITVDPDDRKKGSGIRPGHVYVKTMHEVKGLEFGAVLISGISSRMMGFSLNKAPEVKREEAEEFRSLVYVALTRAIRYAEISGHSISNYGPYEGFDAVSVSGDDAL